MTGRPQKDFDPSFASSSCPEVEVHSIYYIRVCKSKTYLILKNILNRVQN